MEGIINQIFNEDCLTGMDKIPDGSIDMILCDLPYGTTNNYWDKRIPFEPLWAQYKRITKKNAAIVLFSQMPFGAELIMSNRKMFRYEWIWQKNIGAGFLNANKMPLRVHENILVFYYSLPTYNPQYIQGEPYQKLYKGQMNGNYGKKKENFTFNEGKRYPIDTMKFKIPNSGGFGDKTHSTQKPIDLLEYLIKTYTNEGELVLDNCIGSGSTAVAAINTNRNFIGFETEEKYCEIANKRIGEAKANREAQPKEGVLFNWR